MKDMKEIIEKIAYMRIDELPEEKKSEVRLREFCKDLEGESRSKLWDILDDKTAEQDRREKNIYIRGLKDGYVFANFLMG